MENRRRASILTATAAALMVCVSFAHADGPALKTGPKPDGFVIGPDDTLKINILNCDEITKEAWHVNATGELNLPYAGTIIVAGMTKEQVQQELTLRMKRYIIEPQVSVFVTEVRSRPVIVTGSVAKPGTYQLDGPKTIFDLVVLAGGPVNSGNKVTLKREASEGPLKIPTARVVQADGYASAEFDLADVLKGKGDTAEIEVKPHDQISVAVAGPPRLVFVTGEVPRPGSVELVTQDSISLTKVLAIAGMPGPNANAKKTQIMHISPEGNQTARSVIDVNKILSGKAKDVELIAGDVVVVQTSSLKSYAHMATGSAIQVGMYSAITLLARF